jgi:uncharacterized membrane protein YoaT (DUF817 family)
MTLARTQTRFHRIRTLLEQRTPRSRWREIVWEVGLFGFKQAWACCFGAVMLALVMGTKYLYPAHAWLARYDFLFLAALGVQVILLLTRMETVREAKVILVFHVVGTGMELFKTHVGSWTYPELAGGHAFFHVGHVPLFSGFMYASVGSYLARATRILDMRYTRYPRRVWTFALAGAIYANFFAHHFMADLRWVLFAAIAVVFGRTWVYYRPHRTWRRMPLVMGFSLVALFIFAAENIGTFAHAWVYPNQRGGWEPVRLGMFGSWLLLMIISFVLVTLAKAPQEPPLGALVETGLVAGEAAAVPGAEA